MVKIRLMRMGRKKHPIYRIVVADERVAQHGNFIEQVGTYDPNREPSLVNIDAELTKKWISNGAKPTDVVNKLIKKAGIEL